MNLEISNKRENILLSRIEVEADISFEKKATPSNEDVRQALSKQLNVDPALVAVKKISTAFGSASGRVLAYQYLNKEDMKRLEPESKKQYEKKDTSSKEQAKKEDISEKEETKEPKDNKKVSAEEAGGKGITEKKAELENEKKG